MACVPRLQRLLDERQVEYQVVPHREAFTAQEVAQSTHVPGRMLAKVVVLRTGSAAWHLFTIPATAQLALDVVQEVTGLPVLGFATEPEIQRLFPDCEVGAMPPFGALWDVPMSLDAAFDGAGEIYFQAGNHHEVVRMRFADYRRVAGPFAHIAHFERPVKAARG